MNASLANRFVAVHSLVSFITFALEGFAAVSVLATGKPDALFTKLTSPSNVAVTRIWLGAVSVDACLIGNVADGNLAELLRN